MKYALSLLISLFVFSAATTAHAQDVRGRIDTIDTAANQFALENGIKFSYDGELDEAQLAEGARVKVTYKNVKGRFHVKRLRVISAPKG